MRSYLQKISFNKFILLAVWISDLLLLSLLIWPFGGGLLNSWFSPYIYDDYYLLVADLLIIFLVYCIDGLARLKNGFTLVYFFITRLGMLAYLGIVILPLSDRRFPFVLFIVLISLMLWVALIKFRHSAKKKK